MDNLSTHTETSLVRHYGPERGARIWRRFTVHYTPKHGSWLNQAEIAICMMNRQSLHRLRFETIEKLRNHIAAWTRAKNTARTCIDWRLPEKNPVFGLAGNRRKLTCGSTSPKCVACTPC